MSEPMTKKAYHPSGLSVTFDERPHTYTVDQTGQVLTSGTTFIDQFFPKFESEKVARKCAGKKKRAYPYNWPSQLLSI
jgi:hypothetical protein